MISLLNYYRWSKFSIIYEETWETVAQSLEQQAKERNMTVNQMKRATDRHKCCENKLQCCQSGYWYKFIQDTKNRTRSNARYARICARQLIFLWFSVYVFLGTKPSLLDFMQIMQTLQLFDNGEYMVIYVDMETYSDKEAHRYLFSK